MRAAAFWSIVTADESRVLERVTDRLSQLGVPYCVVGGQAVNAYVEPLVSLDLDLAVAVPELERILPAFERDFHVERFPHSVNLSAAGSDLRVQFQLDPRYGDFVTRATPRAVLGRTLPVAALEDVLQGKVWAAMDPSRRASKRQKDLADIARILEAFPQLTPRVPATILERLL